MELPKTLAERAVLVSWDVPKNRLRRSQLPIMLNAAVLVDLWLAGHVTGERDVLAAGDPSARAETRDLPAEQVAMLRRIHGSSRPRRWKHWVRKESTATWRTVRDRMEAGRVLQVEPRSFLGIDRSRVTVRDPRAGEELVARCRRAVLGSTPATSLDPADAALVALVAAIELNTVFTGKERRAHRHRIKEISERSGPAAKALRAVINDNTAAAASAGG
jgi:hypothetical protein